MMIAKFWWSGDLGKRKIHWLNWRVLCKSKQEGGLGFRDLYAFNLALLAKQSWHFLHNPEALVYRVFKARYFPATDFLEAQVDNGKMIHIWEDKWVPTESCLRILTPTPLHWNGEATMEGLLRPDEEVELIQRIPLSLRDIADCRVWHYDPHGRFTVRSAYHVAQGIMAASGERVEGSHSYTSNNVEKLWKKLWTACVPGKVESVEHVLPDCHVAKAPIYIYRDLWWDLSFGLMLVWSLWQHQKDVLWNGKYSNPDEIVHRCHKMDIMKGRCELQKWKRPVEEFLATRHAAHFVKGLYSVNVQVQLEGDASLVLAAIKGQGEDSRWLVMCNEKEIRRLVGFARLGLTCTQEIVWFEEPPDLIQDILFEEGL
ncbi:hypothetical protein ACFX2F_032477 [Malus domestica]